jgi:hypothetical protein
MDNGVTSRRQVLRAGGIATAVTLAGCLGGDGGNGNGNDKKSAGPEKTELTPADCTPETISSDISEDTTWSPEDCPRKAIDGNVRVANGATLTIEPGVEVVGMSGSRITVRPESTLTAQGESTNPVWFYGETDATGYWQGIRFRSETANELDNVVVRNGGQDNWANIYLDDNAQVSVTNTLSERSSAAGLVATGGTTLAAFSNNEFRGNEFAAMDVRTTHLGMLDSGSIYAGDNGEDVIHVKSRSVGSDATWPATDAPYRFEGSNHKLNAAVTVDPGGAFVFESGARITVRPDGAFTVEGESDNPVTFEGETAEPGFWQGIRYRSNNPNNSIDNAEIAHGGQDNWANVYLDDDAQAAITNTLSEQSSTAGLVATGGTTLAAFSNNEFRGNEFAAMDVRTTHLGTLDAESSYASDNGTDVIHVKSRSVGTDATWPATDAPYRFEGSNHKLNAAVTVDPGGSFVFQEGARITVRPDGSFTAEGGSDDKITFEGETAEPGFWQGIRYRSNNPNNSIDNAEIAYGGQDGWANVYLDDNAQAAVTNSTLQASSTYGIIVTSGASLDASGNTFENNAKGKIDNQNN